MRGKENGEGWLEGLGNGLDTVNETVRSKMTERSLPGRLLSLLRGSSMSGKTAGWEVLNLCGDVKQALENN